MAIGYLNSSPFEAFIEAMVMHTIFSIHKAIRRGMPIIIKQSGISNKVYNNSES